MIVKKGFIAEGTTCGSCAAIIKRQAMKIRGVKEVEFDLAKETGTVTFDDTKTDLDKILYSIEEKGYSCFILDDSKAGKKTPTGSKNILSSKPARTAGLLFAILGIAIVAFFALKLTDAIALPELSANASYGLLFLVGLLTGFHCVAMCGGFVVSYTAKAAQEKQKPHASHFMYGLGKTISYTIIGALFGLLGSFIAFTPTLKGMIGILAGIFLVIFGLRMLNIFPSLRKLNLNFKTPSFVSKFVTQSSTKKTNKGPLVIGLLNGLMLACGPLQAMYVLAAGTGSMVEGAKMLFIFGLGTLPVMIGFGYLASIVSSKLTTKILKASGVIVIILGLIMLNRGLVLTGSGYDLKSTTAKLGLSSGLGTQSGSLPGTDLTTSQTAQSATAGNIAIQKEGYQEIHMDVTAGGWSPDTFILKKGVPVHWVINVKQLTSCNNAIQVPKYNLEFKLAQGEQTIEFTPTESGIVPWSCWMGMIPGTFIVKDDLSGTSLAQAKTELATAKAASPKTGGCGCGMR